MALKKSERYSSLRQSCHELCGGMDASRYKAYVLPSFNLKCSIRVAEIGCDFGVK